MNDHQIKILGVNVSNLSLRQVLESVEKYLSKLETDGRKPLVIFTPNPEIIVYAQKDEEFKKIVNTAQINVPDGVGLILAAKFLGKPLKEKISGVDLMEKLAELARNKSLTVGLIGGGEGVALKALECLRSRCPNLKGVILDCPEFRVGVDNKKVESRKQQVVSKEQNDFLSTYYLLPATKLQVKETQEYFKRLIGEIYDKKINILFVGLGCPKQEYFIHNFEFRISNFEFPLVLMAVGGSFDYLSGRVKRAPLFIRSIGFEWVWRLLLQPWRIKRQLSLVKFVWLILKQKKN